MGGAQVTRSTPTRQRRRSGDSPIAASRRFFAMLIVLFLAAVACTIQPPTVRVQVAGDGQVAGAAAGTDGSLQPGEPGGAEGAAAGGAAAAGGGTVEQIDATSAAGAAAASRNCRPQAVNQPGVTNTGIKLGSTFARSGPVANISGPIEQGVRAYLREVNEAGGICGRRLNLVGYDDGWNPQEGARLIRKLVEDDEVFFLSVVPSSLGLQAATEYLKEKGVPAVGTSGLLESQFKTPGIQWPVGASTGLSGVHVSVPFLVKERQITKFAGFYVNDLEVGQLAAATVEDEVNRNGVRLCAALQGRALSATDYSSGWATILNESQRNCGGPPEYVFFLLDPSGIIRAAKQASWRPTKGWGGGPPAFLDLIPQQVGPGLSDENTPYQAQSPYLPPIAPFLNVEGVQAYTKTVQKYYGSGVDLKNPFLEGGYCGAALTVEAIRQAGAAPTRAKITAALDNLTNWSCGGLTRPITYRNDSHYGNRSLVGVRLEFQGNSWVWKPETCTAPGDSCWRTDQRPGVLPPPELMNKYKS